MHRLVRAGVLVTLIALTLVGMWFVPAGSDAGDAELQIGRRTAPASASKLVALNTAATRSHVRSSAAAATVPGFVRPTAPDRSGEGVENAAVAAAEFRTISCHSGRAPPAV